MREVAGDLAAGLEAALFGRMVTSDPEANTNAAIHVAHSFTVHKEESEKAITSRSWIKQAPVLGPEATMVQSWHVRAFLAVNPEQHRARGPNERLDRLNCCDCG
jgi:CT1975-like protein